MHRAPSRASAAAALAALLGACAPAASAPAPAPTPSADVPASVAWSAPGAAQGPPAPAARPEDVASEEAIVRALYETISGPAGPRDWNRLRSLFAPGARIIFAVTQADGTTAFGGGDVERYIAANTPYLMEHAWQEHEIARRVERYGSIAHVLSTYEGDEGPGTERERGINSIQLVRHDGRWWVVNLMVDKEAAWNPIPRTYLP